MSSSQLSDAPSCYVIVFESAGMSSGTIKYWSPRAIMFESAGMSSGTIKYWPPRAIVTDHTHAGHWATSRIAMVQCII